MQALRGAQSLGYLCLLLMLGELVPSSTAQLWWPFSESKDTKTTTAVMPTTSKGMEADVMQLSQERVAVSTSSPRNTPDTFVEEAATSENTLDLAMPADSRTGAPPDITFPFSSVFEGSAEEEEESEFLQFQTKSEAERSLDLTGTSEADLHVKVEPEETSSTLPPKTAAASIRWVKGGGKMRANFNQLEKTLLYDISFRPQNTCQLQFTNPQSERSLRQNGETRGTPAHQARGDYQEKLGRQAVLAIQDLQGLQDYPARPFQEHQAVLVPAMEMAGLREPPPLLKAPLDHRVCLATQALLEPRDIQGQKALKDLLVSQGMKANQGHQVFLVPQANLDHQGPLDRQVCQDQQGQRGLQEPWAPKDIQGFQAPKGHQDPQAFLDKKVLQDEKGLQDRMGQRVKRVRLAYKDPQAIQDWLEKKGLVVHLVPWDPLAYLEKISAILTQDFLDLQDLRQNGKGNTELYGAILNHVKSVSCPTQASLQAAGKLIGPNECFSPVLNDSYKSIPQAQKGLFHNANHSE
ncbi:hypothetical protein JD844_002115 [Phrynosoma platyrhinos]|uniref:Uncharacterized protein n=1 Tax=Phrynosoma platyrhinos TaxID=52577 RepID=A0ABQ7TCH1_PHRPL|nr:hypothetical protein JD844_002115 [Phrynosoma platyrhinos]